METKQSYLYLVMVGAAASVILLSLAGIATITGVLPIGATSTSDFNKPAQQQDCQRCGVIESVWSMEGEESKVQPPSDEGEVRYAVRVSMEDGSYRTLYYSEPPLFQTGERVKVSDGALVLR